MPSPIVVQERQGLYVPEFDLWMDSRRRRARGFVSHAHGDHFARHGWTLCSPETRRLIEVRYGPGALKEVVTPAWGEPMEWGQATLRLWPAGHILGSAMLQITRRADGASLLYTGDFKLRQGFSCERAELVEADTLVMETTFGRPRFCFPPAAQVREELLTFVRETLAAGGVPVLLGYALGKAQEILAALAGADVPVMLHDHVARLAAVYEECRPPVTAWKPFVAAEAAGHALIFPPPAARHEALRGVPGVRAAMLSGWALTSGAKHRFQVDEVFPLSDHADYPELLECVERVKPRVVYTVHGYTSDFARDLRARGWEAWSLSGENQLELPLSLPVP